MFNSVTVLRPGARVLAVLVAAMSLALLPSTAFADNIEGTDNSETLVGTPGDDTIDAKGGDDSVLGDNVGVNGGDDQISGGDGNDGLVGDGFVSTNGGDDDIDGGDGGDGDDTLYGDGVKSTNGGDDRLNGGTGNDILHGDGPGGDFDYTFPNGQRVRIFGAIEVLGGDDVLIGGAGNDRLYGDSGNDVLCGEDGHTPVNPLDYLEGGLGTDIACAVDDEITVDAGVESMLDLKTNDDSLDDESTETQPLRYRLADVPSFISAVLDELTAVLTFTATTSGTIGYEVCRTIGTPLPPVPNAAPEEICSGADVFVTVNAIEPDDTIAIEPDDTIEKTANTAKKPQQAPTVLTTAQVLPDTGASTDPRVLLPVALTLILGGGLMIGTGRRRTA